MRQVRPREAPQLVHIHAREALFMHQLGAREAGKLHCIHASKAPCMHQPRRQHRSASVVCQEAQEPQHNCAIETTLQASAVSRRRAGTAAWKLHESPSMLQQSAKVHQDCSTETPAQAHACFICVPKEPQICWAHKNTRSGPHLCQRSTGAASDLCHQSIGVAAHFVPEKHRRCTKFVQGKHRCRCTSGPERRRRSNIYAPGKHRSCIESSAWWH